VSRIRCPAGSLAASVCGGRPNVRPCTSCPLGHLPGALVHRSPRLLRQLPGATTGIPSLVLMHQVAMRARWRGWGSGPIGRSRQPTEFRQAERQDAARGPHKHDAIRAGRRNDQGSRAALQSRAKLLDRKPIPAEGSSKLDPGLRLRRFPDDEVRGRDGALKLLRVRRSAAGTPAPRS
jgi:hypothetical protein